MEIDAFLILTLAVLVWQSGKTGGWVLLSGALRYGFVALGQVLPWLRQPLPATPPPASDLRHSDRSTDLVPDPVVDPTVGDRVGGERSWRC